ncbi:acetylornithine deacetylase [Microvirga makkahensis]|nr:acetylornithine deacetylase [Microvirga makkahensis]
MPTDDLVSLDLIRDLVRFDTTSRNSNLELIGYIRDYLAGLGIESTLILDETGRKASLYATVGPQDRGGILLSGHTDTVPVDGQDWTSDPFTLSRRGDRLYGRGTADMKSFVAIALAFAPAFAKSDLKIPIHYAFSYDEEIGCLGVRPLIAYLNTLPIRPRMAIIGEPTEMQVICAHKGKLATRCRVEGKSCHSSLAPRGVNAVEYAAEVVAYLRGMARRIAAEGPFDEGFDIPHTTIHTGVIRGGTVLNIVPSECEFDFEFRYLPEQNPDALLAEVKRFAHDVLEPQMKAVAPNAGFSWRELSSTPGLDVAPEDEVVTIAKALAGQNGQSKVAFATEASLFQKSGSIPAVVCGPGNIDQAHKPDEYIELSEVAKGEAFMRDLLDRITA